MATALEADRTAGGAGLIAAHWLAAGDAVGFARWALPAADEARADDEHLRAAELLDQLSDWWHRPGVPEAAGCSRPVVLVRAARAHRYAGAGGAAADRCRAALDDDTLDGVTEAVALTELAGASAELGDPEAHPTAELALAKAMALPDTPESARLVALAAGALGNFGDRDTVVAASATSAERARRWGASAVEAIATNTIGSQLAASDPEASEAAFEQSRLAAAALVHDEPALMLRYYVNATYGRAVAGKYEDSAALALEGLDFVAERGLRRTTGAHLAAAAGEALLSAGNLTLARATIGPWMASPSTGRDQWWLESVRGRAVLLAGDLAGASAALDSVDAAVGTAELPMSAAVALALLRAEVAAATRPARSAAAIALEGARAVLAVDPAAVPELLCFASRAVRLAGPGTGGLWGQIDRAWAALPTMHSLVAHRWRELHRAEQATASGADPRRAWVAAEAAFEASNGPQSWSARVSLTAASVLVEHGAVARARVCHERAASAIARGGFGLLVPELARVTALLGSNRGPSEALTGREVEVLRVLSRGASNVQVGNLLRISPRTVEVHVGRILLKLGAANRGAAVASALRLGILDPDDLVALTSSA